MTGFEMHEMRRKFRRNQTEWGGIVGLTRTRVAFHERKDEELDGPLGKLCEYIQAYGLELPAR